MSLNLPNLDRQQKENIPLGEALEKAQNYINLIASLKGSWVAATVYAQGDIVLYSGVLYRSLVSNNVGNIPGSSQWQTVGTARVAAPTFITPGSRQG